MVDYFYLTIYKFFGFILWIFPRKIIINMMKGISWIAYSVSKKHQNIIHTNLDIAFNKTLSKKEKKAYGVSAFMNLLDTTLGIISRDGMNKNEVIKNVTFEGEEIVKKYQSTSKKIIFITGHQGNWELLSQSIAIKFNLTLVGVGRELDSKLMDNILKENRERFNVEMVYKKGAMKGCIKALGQNKAVGILVDQSIRQNQSIEVDFFNQKATHTPLASILSRKFEIDLIPAFISTDDYINYHVKIYEPIKTIKTDNQEEDLAKLTQAQANAMQVAIEAHPKEWFWMHKRWKNTEENIYKAKI
jgi:KDO2-lipid IV(A) lauroyltransferase